jgi:hypothetical protein
MTERLDRNHPAIQRFVDSTLSDAMDKNGLTSEQVRRDLEARVEVHYGYHNEPLLRIRSNDRTLLTADRYLEGWTPSNFLHQSSSGPYRIPKSDRALIDANVGQLASGIAVVTDDCR